MQRRRPTQEIAVSDQQMKTLSGITKAIKMLVAGTAKNTHPTGKHREW